MRCPFKRIPYLLHAVRVGRCSRRRPRTVSCLWGSYGVVRREMYSLDFSALDGIWKGADGDGADDGAAPSPGVAAAPPSPPGYLSKLETRGPTTPYFDLRRVSSTAHRVNFERETVRHALAVHHLSLIHI